MNETPIMVYDNVRYPVTNKEKKSVKRINKENLAVGGLLAAGGAAAISKSKKYEIDATKRLKKLYELEKFHSSSPISKSKLESKVFKNIIKHKSMKLGGIAGALTGAGMLGYEALKRMKIVNNKEN